MFELIDLILLLLEAELVFGDIVNEIDLVVEGERSSQRRQNWIAMLWSFFPHALYQFW